MATEDDPTKQPDKTDESKPDFLTKDEARSIMAGIIQSSLKKDLPRVLGELLGPQLDTALGPLKEQLAGLSKPKTEEDSNKGKEPPTKPGVNAGTDETADKPDPKFEALEKKLKRLEDENKAARDSAAAERKRRVENDGYATLRSELTGKVKAEALDMCIDLVRARGQLAFDDDGNPRMKVRAKIAKDLPEEDQELAIPEAVPHWLKSKEAQLFLPPPTQQQTRRNVPAGQRASNGQFAGNNSDPIAAFEAEHGSLDENL